MLCQSSMRIRGSFATFTGLQANGVKWELHTAYIRSLSSFLVGGGVHICCVIIEIQKISLFFIPWTAVVKLDSFNEMNYSKTTFSNTAHCSSTSRSLHPPPHLIPPNLLCLILFTPSSQYRCSFFTRSSLMPWLWTLAKNEFYIFK